MPFCQSKKSNSSCATLGHSDFHVMKKNPRISVLTSTMETIVWYTLNTDEDFLINRYKLRVRAPFPHRTSMLRGQSWFEQKVTYLSIIRGRGKHFSRKKSQCPEDATTTTTLSGSLDRSKKKLQGKAQNDWVVHRGACGNGNICEHGDEQRNREAIK